MAYPVKVCWAKSYVPLPGVGVETWNETCARVLERFGLPGGKYITEVTEDYMIFNFNDPDDALVATLMIGDHGCNNSHKPLESSSC